MTVKNILILSLFLSSCSHIGENTKNKTSIIDKSKFEKYAIDSFKESRKTGTSQVKNLKVDTVLVISTQIGERIKIKKFKRDYKMFCELDSIPYSPKFESDSIARWLKRAEKLSINDTIGYRVKFKLDYILKNGKRDPNVWIKSFNKYYKSYDELDGPLLEEEYFLLDDLK